MWLARQKASVGLEPKIPKELKLLYFGTENFKQFRFQYQSLGTA